MERPAAIPVLIAVAIAATLLVAVSAATSFGQRTGPAARDEVPETRSLEPVERFLGPPRPAPAEAGGPRPAREGGPRRARPAAPSGFGIVRVRAGRSVRLYSKPKGSGVATVGARTQFGSRSVMSVVRRRGRWLAVTTTALGNGRTAWVRADSPAVDRSRVRMAISVDLSRRTLELRRGKRLLKSVKVAIGRAGSSTPRGRFAVTDKIPGSRYGAYYGCCILALNGTQPNTPPGWRGGNRLAIHGTNAPGSIGKPTSAGCLRAADADLRTLMRRVPLGTPVFVHG
ncbi:MAG TPA: L,D-transpeptidase [Thermoleophilaceae bacterium]|jgi:lipoprotein-anchoring transpeptidase ErfK/SrfK